MCYVETLKIEKLSYVLLTPKRKWAKFYFVSCFVRTNNFNVK